MKMPTNFTEVSEEEMVSYDGGFSLGSLVGMIETIGGIGAGIAGTIFGGLMVGMIAMSVTQTVGGAASSIISETVDKPETEAPLTAPTTGY